MKTVSKDLAIKLKENGYPQDYGHHYGYYSDEYWNKNGTTEVKYSYGREHVNLVNSHWNFIGVAPTADELLDQLPHQLNIKNGEKWVLLKIGKIIDSEYNYQGYEVVYKDFNENIIYLREQEITLADTLAKMWLYLKEQSLISQKEKK